LVACLGAGVTFLLQEKFENQRNLAEQNDKLKKSISTQDSLSLALNHEIERFTALQEKYAELNQKNTQIEALIAQLQKEKNDWQNRSGLNEAQIQELEKKLQRTMAEFEIKRLEMLKDVDSLKIVNTNLKLQNSDLKFSNDSLKASSQDQLLVNRGILKKVGKLKAENMRTSMLDAKGNPLKSPYRGSKIQKIVYTFNLEKNEYAELGKKQMVMRIEKPDGGILYDVSANGNTFTTANKEQFYYTVAKEINFDNTYQEVSLTYNKQGEINQGIYHVQIFADGVELLKSQFEVK
jgi:hypothetical protein